MESTRLVLRYLCDTDDIDRSFKGYGIFELDDRAFRGASGLFCRSSVRTSKWDCYPSHHLVEVLRSS